MPSGAKPLSKANGYSKSRVIVLPTCRISLSRRSLRTSLCTLPSALVLLLPSAPLVSVPPRITLDWVRSHQLSISSKALGSPVAASRKSSSMPAGMMPAALWPMPTSARSSVIFSFSLAPLGYLPMRTGMP